jgi:PAS domain S-box-containing protein
MHSHRLRSLRQAKGFTLDQLSAASGIHRGTIHRIELGQVSPRVDTLRELCTALGADLQHLFVQLPAPAEADAGGFKRGMLEWMPHLEALIHHSPDALMVLDRNGFVLYEGQSTTTLFGADSARRRSSPWPEWVHPQDRPEVLERLRLLVATPGAAQSLDYRVAAADGRWRWVTSNAINQFAHPVIQGIIISSQDTTRLKGLEADLRTRLTGLQAMAGTTAADAMPHERAEPIQEVYLLLTQDGTILECQASAANHPLGAFAADTGVNLRALPLPAEILESILAMIAAAFKEEKTQTRSFTLDVAGERRLQEARVKCNAGPVALLRFRDITARA